jgi:BTB/POZ domain-containing protein KCTD9
MSRADSPRIPEEKVPQVFELAARLYAEKKRGYSATELIQAGQEVNIPPEFIQQAIDQIQSQELQNQQTEKLQKRRKRKGFRKFAIAFVMFATIVGIGHAFGDRDGDSNRSRNNNAPVYPIPYGEDLRGADFANANLRGVDFRNKDLRGANFSFANLEDADFTGSNLAGANLTGANLKDAQLNDANLSSANLSRANLEDAQLSNANLANADLAQANLKDADLSDTNLINANLSGADLSDTNLDGASLDRSTNLNGVNTGDRSLPERAN